MKKDLLAFAIIGFSLLSAISGIGIYRGYGWICGWMPLGALGLMCGTFLTALWMLYKFYKGEQNVP